MPTPVAGALLAGVLFPLCLAPVTAVRRTPVVALLVVLVWLALRRWRPVLAVPAAMVVALAATVADLPSSAALHWVPTLTPVLPQFDPTSSSPSACRCTS